MPYEKTNPRRLAGRAGANEYTTRTNYGHMVCTCQGARTCNTCTHFGAISLAGAGYRAWWPQAKLRAWLVAVAVAQASGTIAATPTGAGARNTTSEAVATPTESGVLSCPNAGHGRISCAAMLQGFGQGASVRKAGGVASDTLRTPCPPDARRNAEGGFSTPEGA